jgi:Zn-dependent protease
MEELSLIQKLAVLALPVIFAVTLHEAAHGWMADRLGDRTARMMGRVTLNPLKHIDLIGTVLVPLGMFALTGFMFGWAKPVPIDPRNLKQPRRDMALVAAAGPGANLLMALLWGLGILLGQHLLQATPWVAVPLIYMGAAGVLINVILMVLNLLPIPPLDGSRVVASLLPYNAARSYAKIEPYGLFIVLALLVTGLLGRIVFPLVIAAILLLPGAPLVLQLFF